MPPFEAEQRMMTDNELYLEHLLCRELGWGTVEAMRRQMSHVELLEHRAFLMRRMAERGVR